MNASTTPTLAEQQFGPQASAYVASAVHAAGEDLQRLTAITAEHRPAEALDLGCGGGHAAFHVAPHAGTVVACDLSVDMLEAVTAEAQRRGLDNVSTQRATAESLPFDDARFDLVCTRFSAHHWRDMRAGMREARRVLKPGGMAVLMDVVSPGQALLDTHLQVVETLRDPSHVRNYSLAEWMQAVAEAGLVADTVRRHRLRMAFANWTARMHTPSVHVEAIRSLQRQADPVVTAYYGIEPDGSFWIDAVTLEATRPT